MNLKMKLTNNRLWMAATLMALWLLVGLQVVSAQSGGLRTTVTIEINLRAGPGTEWLILDTLPEGAAITLDGQAYQGTWARGITADGTIGWVASRYLAAPIAQIENLRVVWVDDPFSLEAPAPSGPRAATTTSDDDADTETTTEADDAPPQTITNVNVSGARFTGTATANVNMRGGPGTNFRRVGGVDFGSEVAIDGRNEARTWVRAVNSAGEVGWISAAYVRLSTDINNIPVVDPNSPFSLNVPAQAAPQQEAAAPDAETNNVPVPNNAPVTGFGYGGHVQSLNNTTVNAMNRAGMTWVKKQIRFGGGGGGGAGIINEAHANGFRVVLGVVGNAGSVTEPGYFDRYASFVAGLAAAGADAIEIWNEPNIDREWAAGNIDPAAYTELLRVSYNAIKAANPNTLVISGAPAPTGFFGGCSGAGCNDDQFIQGMAAAGAANYMDCVGVHYNEGIVPPTATSGDPRGNSGYYTRYLPAMIDVYSNAFGGRVPLCFTELGYLTGEGYGPLPGAFAWAASTTVAQQAAWLDGAVAYSRGSGRVLMVIIWNVDFSNYGADPMAGFAMIRPDGSCPACDALGS